MKTLLIGNFGARNVGDELILESALRQHPESVVMTSDSFFSQTFCGQEFETVRFFPTGGRSLLEFCLSKSYRQSLKDLQGNVDRVIFPGGGLFAIKFRAYLLWRLVFWWTKKYFPDAEIRFEHQGVDASHFLNKILARKPLQNADFVSVRDRESQLAVLDIATREVENVGDRVQVRVRDVEKSHKQKVVLINALRPFEWPPLQDKLQHLIAAEYLILFVALQESDLDTLPADFEGDWTFPKRKKDLFDLFRAAEYVVGERFHSLVLAEAFCDLKNIYTLRMPYSEKVQNFCSKKGIEHLEGKMINSSIKPNKNWEF